MDLKMERLSKSNTLLARCRNLLREKEANLPPELEEEIDDQIENYESYLAIRKGSEIQDRKDDIEALERSLEIIEDQQARRGIQEQINRLEKEIQEIETRDTESLVADPDWI
jgi:polyhydroxyalkanoate synthesis regulator phasin